MKFYAFHGVQPQEKRVGQHFTASLSLAAPLEKALASDDLADTIDYAAVYEIVKKEIDQPSCLLEHVAGRILGALKQNFPQLTEIELSLSKLNPPVAGEMHSAAVILKETY